MSVNFLCVRHKNRRRHNQYFELLFFKKIDTLADQTKDLHMKN